MTDPETTERSGRVDESDEDTSEAQAQVIASLRAQVTDLFSQVTQLNSKLVASYDRVSGLEDQLHDTSSSLRNASVTISSLELERSHHLAALNTGLLVEKAHVTAELNRLMERATEEAAQRGQAETARHDIEKDLDDLSASLFDQANTMVAEARLNQAKSERKVQDAEQALKIAEDAVKDMQIQMQSLQAEKEAAERDVQEARLTVRKGKWAQRDDTRVGEVPRMRFMTTHAPYAEFITFVAHLRGLRVSQPTAPVISTLLSHPFIARLLTEDSEPTVRLDLAPSLNWLSRRSVLAAIHTGMLTVEPLPFATLVQELHQHPQSMSASSLNCALCGTLITRIPASPVSRSHNTNGSSWFKYPLALGSTQNHNAGSLQSAECEPPGQVYIFRLAPPTTSPPPSAGVPTHTSSASLSAVGTSSRPPLSAISSSRVLQAQTPHSPYPLCPSNYCLTRLRSTCSLWAFVRVGIVERIWEEEVVQPLKPHVNGSTRETPSSLAVAGTGNKVTGSTIFPLAAEKPPVPPRRRRLWEMASALGERAVSWGKESGEHTKEKEKESERETTKKLPIPPPSHPSAPHPHVEPSTFQMIVQDPPPLPKRNVIRPRSTTDAAVLPSGMQSETVAAENKESDANPNGHLNSDKVDLKKSGSSSPVDDITFTTSPSEAMPPVASYPYPVTANAGAFPIQDGDSPRPSSPHNIPLPATPTTPSPISRVGSPTPRSRSRLSSPASPPPATGSRPTSPAISRPHAGSPVPTTIARTTSPSPGHPPSAPHIWGKPSTVSPLASSSRSASPAPATGPGAPPLPKRAATRRAIPPPPSGTLGSAKGAEEGTMEEGISPVTPADPASEANAGKEPEADVRVETKNGDGEGGTGAGAEADVIREENERVSHAALVSGLAAESDPSPAKDDGVGDAIDAVHGSTEEGAVNGTSATAVADPRGTEGKDRTSMETTSTKRSSSTESEAFASDATWEERTWKELVRLREDMFWARTGGVRASRG